jgi:hypothetical protein
VSKKSSVQDSRQILMFGEVISNGLGGYTVIPKKPVAEVDSKAAAKMLGVSMTTLHSLVNDREASKILRWRWISEKRGKRLWDAESLRAYREATTNSEFGMVKR